MSSQQSFISRHHAFIVAMLASLAGGAVAYYLRPELVAGVATTILFWVYLLFVALRFHFLTASYLKKHARNEDVPAVVMLGIALLATVTAVINLFLAANDKDMPALPMAFAFASVGGGWLTLHTMSAIHYAHVYWRKTATAEDGKPVYRRGLDFPGTPDPGGYDFLYFSMVIGMTAQTSDTALTTTEMRKLNLRHAVTSYLFNTVLIAAAVNVAVGLAH